ncbi:hypothetical protein [Bradyrhizobium sp. DOA1]|uniref:hypothetical protein n=1 Tax=Bradyrhizobium sp. DOA1 TaxID=1126616 RepID=UPI000AB191AF|nr:hypothetical protein [Bradyrhizobium sp. DOA1]
MLVHDDWCEDRVQGVRKQYCRGLEKLNLATAAGARDPGYDCDACPPMELDGGTPRSANGMNAREALTKSEGGGLPRQGVQRTCPLQPGQPEPNRGTWSFQWQSSLHNPQPYGFRDPEPL